MRQDARDVALGVLVALDEREAYLQPALQAACDRARLSPVDRRLALELTAGVTRWRNRLDYTLERLLTRGLADTDPLAVRIMRLAAYQLIFLDRIPARAAIHRAVEQAKWNVGHGVAGVTNGVLRALDREGEVLPQGDDPASLAVRWGHPEWMVRRWLAQGPEHAEAIAAAHNAYAPLTIRVDRPGADREALAAVLQAEGAETEPTRWAPDALHLRGLAAPFDSPSFKDGWWQVQDEASQLVVVTLDPQPGESVWDACAAPGGKSRYIARRMGGEGRVLATDRHPKKAERLGRSLRHLACVEVRHGDASEPPDETFDRVLLDAPCTGLGVLRRHPESKWRRTPEDITHAAETQLALLAAVAGAVRPGGVLVYSVCSDAPEEGPDTVAAFLEGRSEFTLEEARRLSPHEHGTDGFHIAKMRRR